MTLHDSALFQDSMSRSDNVASLELMARQILEVAVNGGVVWTFGNGGSCAEADHLSAELLGAYEDRTRRPIMSVNLGAQPASLTAISNDFGYDNYLDRCIGAMGPRDLCIMLSTSAKSRNIIGCLGDWIYQSKAPRFALLCGLGFIDHEFLPQVPVSKLPRFVVQSRRTSEVQEATLQFIHVLCGRVEKLLTGVV